MGHAISRLPLMPVATIWRLQEIPKALPPDFVAELRRRIRDGAYDSPSVVTEIARALLRSGAN